MGEGEGSQAKLKIRHSTPQDIVQKSGGEWEGAKRVTFGNPPPPPPPGLFGNNLAVRPGRKLMTRKRQTMILDSEQNIQVGSIRPRGGHSGTEGGRTCVTYFAEEGVFF